MIILLFSCTSLENSLTDYNGTEFKWTMGRRLKSALRSDGIKIKYTYNADGLRTSKTIRNVKFNYYWNGDKLTSQTCGDNTWYFRYDGDTPIGFEYNGNEYYYVTNLQGDIIAILNSYGACVAEYSYDAWGNCTVTENLNGIAFENPLRYRGYYYDSDTNLYYLQSRYYDSNTGRFINADDAAMIMQDVYNLFDYCDNNPVMFIDPEGYAKTYVIYYKGNNGFDDQVKKSAYFEYKGKNVKCIGVRTVMDFVNAWNSMKGKIQRVFIYVHGEEGMLCFSDGNLKIKNQKGYGPYIDFSLLKNVKVNNYVALFSCHGGAGKKQKDNVAAQLYFKTKAKFICACTGGVSYRTRNKKIYAKASANPFMWGYFYNFYYNSKNKSFTMFMSSSGILYNIH